MIVRTGHLPKATLAPLPHSVFGILRRYAALLSKALASSPRILLSWPSAFPTGSGKTERRSARGHDVNWK
eukprot:8500118-Pyramimonas_sp.AAC.1